MRIAAALIFFGHFSMALAPSRGGEQPATVASTAPTTRPASTSGFGPIAYYEESCSRCHGQFGTGYLPDMGKRLSDDALRNIILEMAEGPAAAPLDTAQLEAETAYHRSFIEGTPFLARTSEKPLEGEVTAGATVVVVVNGKTTPAVVEGHTWKAQGAGADGDNVQIVAQRNGKRTTLEANKPYTHAATQEYFPDKVIPRGVPRPEGSGSNDASALQDPWSTRCASARRGTPLGMTIGASADVGMTTTTLRLLSCGA